MCISGGQYLTFRLISSLFITLCVRELCVAKNLYHKLYTVNGSSQSVPLKALRCTCKAGIIEVDY